MTSLTNYEGLHCANCGASMQGEFCHHCGQSIHSVLKPMHHMVEETVETVLHIDGRIVHTLPPLLLKPGSLTLEYFAGRRVRYIAPFRLMFVLCLLAFFVFHVAIDQIADRASTLMGQQATVSLDQNAFKDATTPAEIRQEFQSQLNHLQAARDTGLLPGETLKKLDSAAQDMRQLANRRLAELHATPIPAASATAPVARPEPDATESQPLRISWLPEVLNARLARLGHQLHTNWRAYKDNRDIDPAASAEAKQRMINGVFGMLPPAMFVLIPVFAGLLKLFYVFRRRLYMEHLIVALHSHAFIFLSLLLITLTGMASTWLRPHAAWAGYVLGLVQGALMLWMPIYLLIMQKRIYRQGWPMTLLKYWFIGWCYFWLLGLALLIAAVLGAAH
jgi:hypothetical protein